jgi:hypothetical protein
MDRRCKCPNLMYFEPVCSESGLCLHNLSSWISMPTSSLSYKQCQYRDLYTLPCWSIGLLLGDNWSVPKKMSDRILCCKSGLYNLSWRLILCRLDHCCCLPSEVILW